MWLYEILYQDYIKPIFQDYDSFSKKQKEISIKKGETTTKLPYAPCIKEILGCKTFWEHESYFDGQGNFLTATINPQNEQEYSLKSYVRNLLLFLPDNDSKRQKYLKNLQPGVDLVFAGFRFIENRP